MKKIKIEKLFLFFSLLLFCPSSLLAQEGIRIKADLVLYDQEIEKVSASGNVKVEWQDFQSYYPGDCFFVSTQELWVPYSLDATWGVTKY